MGIYANVACYSKLSFIYWSFAAAYNPTRIDEIKGREREKWEGRKEKGRGKKKMFFIQGYRDGQGCRNIKYA